MLIIRYIGRRFDSAQLHQFRRNRMENRDEMLEAIMVILESYETDYLTEIYDKLTETLH